MAKCFKAMVEILVFNVESEDEALEAVARLFERGKGKGKDFKILDWGHEKIDGGYLQPVIIPTMMPCGGAWRMFATKRGEDCETASNPQDSGRVPFVRDSH